MIGSLFIVDVADEAAAKAFSDGDPFTKAGVFASTKVRKWRWGVKPPKAVEPRRWRRCGYWLLKSEPEAWSWDDQVKAGAKGTPWNGVQEPHRQAQHDGDEDRATQAFFYHSNEGKAVVGVVEVIRRPIPIRRTARRIPGCWSTSGRWRRFRSPSPSPTPRPSRASPRCRWSPLSACRCSRNLAEEWAIVCKMGGYKGCKLALRWLGRKTQSASLAGAARFGHILFRNGPTVRSKSRASRF